MNRLERCEKIRARSAATEGLGEGLTAGKAAEGNNSFRRGRWCSVIEQLAQFLSGHWVFVVKETNAFFVAVANQDDVALRFLLLPPNRPNLGGRTNLDMLDILWVQQKPQIMQCALGERSRVLSSVSKSPMRKMSIPRCLP